MMWKELSVGLGRTRITVRHRGLPTRTVNQIKSILDQAQPEVSNLVWSAEVSDAVRRTAPAGVMNAAFFSGDSRAVRGAANWATIIATILGILTVAQSGDKKPSVTVVGNNNTVIIQADGGSASVGGTQAVRPAAPKAPPRKPGSKPPPAKKPGAKKAAGTTSGAAKKKLGAPSPSVPPRSPAKKRSGDR